MAVRVTGTRYMKAALTAYKFQRLACISKIGFGRNVGTLIAAKRHYIHYPSLLQLTQNFQNIIAAVVDTGQVGKRLDIVFILNNRSDIAGRTVGRVSSRSVVTLIKSGMKSLKLIEGAVNCINRACSLGRKYLK